MIGTKKPVKRPIDLMPPRMTAPARTARTSPVQKGSMPNELRSASATELDCTMLPMPNAAIAAMKAKIPPRKRPNPPPTPTAQVVHGSAAHLAAGIGHAVADAEHRLRVLRRHPDQTGDPHPEERSRTPHRDRRRDSRDVAGADGRCQRRHERLVVRDVSLGADLLPLDQREPQRRPQRAELKATEHDRQVEAGAHQQDQERPTPDPPARR